MRGAGRWFGLDKVRAEGFVRDLRLDQEGVTLPGNRLDVKRLIGGIAKRLPELIHGGIYVGVVIYMGVRGPKARAQFFTGDDFARLFEERDKYLINLALKLEADPVPRHFLPMLINPKWPKRYITAGR